MDKDKEKTKTFPLEKILTISAQEYAGPQVDIGANYELVGVHFGEQNPDLIAVMKSFAAQVPAEAEVVVNYQRSVAGGASDGVMFKYISMSGTALIPKTREGFTEAGERGMH